jgi:hypothetical protein
MKKLFALLAAAFLLAPSATFAAINARIIGVQGGRPGETKILSFESTPGADASVRWVASGSAQEDLSISCKGGERVRVAIDAQNISYVPCDGKLRTAYRGKFTDGAGRAAEISVTGDREVKVTALYKIYRDKNGDRGSLIAKKKLVVKVAPDEE